MTTTVDARGFSCPQPVLMTLDGIKKADSGEMAILVDTDTSKENVSRAAKSQGWQVKEVLQEGGGYRVTIAKER
jgi:tRNA 2-thiouridine synthesizing protein A